MIYIIALTVIILAGCFTIVLPWRAMKARLTYLYINIYVKPKNPRRNHTKKLSGMPEIRASPRK